MATIALRHWRKIAVCCLVTALLLAAPAADAGWLDRYRGPAASAATVAVGSYAVHNASVFTSLKQNAGELIGLFGDMLDAFKEGDARRAEKIWSDVKKVPGDILRESFPVFRVTDAAAGLFAGIGKRLESAKRRIERFARKAGGTDPRIALAVSGDEQPFYASTTGILGDETLPTVKSPAEAEAGTERSWTAFREARRQNDGRRNKQQASSIAADSKQAHDSYDASLKSLGKLWVASRDLAGDPAELETGNYLERLKALDRRRIVLKDERRQQVSKDSTKDQSVASPSMDTSAVPARTTETAVNKSEPTNRTSPEKSNGRTANILSRVSPVGNCVTGLRWEGKPLFRFRSECDREVTLFWCMKSQAFRPTPRELQQARLASPEYPKLCGENPSSANPFYTHDMRLNPGEAKSISYPTRLDIRWTACTGTYDEARTGFISDRSGRFNCKSEPLADSDPKDSIPEQAPELTMSGRHLMTCDTRKRGLFLCAEYKYKEKGKFRAALNSCSSSGNDARLDASCPKGRGASVCLYTTDDFQALTYYYDPQRKNEFAANCKKTKGRYLGKR